MNNNNNNSDQIYIIVGVIIFLCVMSSCAALLIRHIIKSDTGKKSPPSPSPSPSSSPSSSPSPSASAASAASGGASTPFQNCEFKWEYGTVDKSTGKQPVTYKIDKPSSGGGTACEHEDGYIKTEDVKVNCEGSWGTWSGCSKTCNGGTRSRMWITTVGPKNNGTACPSTQSQSCNTHGCKTCQQNNHEKGWAAYYGVSTNSCSGITNKSACENKKVDWTGYGGSQRVCDWK